MSISEVPSKSTARVAGLLYILMGVTGAFSMLFVYNELIVSGDAAATAANITGQESLLRIGVATNLVSQILFLFLAVVLYRLFRSVSIGHARMMVVLVVASVPVAMLNMASQLAALGILSGAGYLDAFNSDQLEALALMLINLHESGVHVAEIFWGLWLFPLGYLVYESGFLPRAIGVALMVACFGYLTAAFLSLLAPGVSSSFPIAVSSVAALAELAFMFWIAIAGIREPGPTGPTSL